MSNLKKQLDEARIGGTFYLKHFRNGKLIHEEKKHNLFVEQGLIYALNAGFGVPVGGAPTPLTNFYIGLSGANRAWLSSDDAANVNTLAAEFQLYTEATRQAWSPQALASAGDVTLDNTGAEATFTIDDLSGVGGSAILYGAFIIDKSAKDGSGDATGILSAGSNFASPRTMYQNDILKIGYVLGAQSA